MSKWDESRCELDILGQNRGLVNASFSYTFYYPSNTNRLWNMLCDNERDIWSLTDVYDLSRFVEDFVLCDHVGVPEYLFHKLGPYLFKEYRDSRSFPLFSFDNQLSDCLDCWRTPAPSPQSFSDQKNSPQVMSSAHELAHEAIKLAHEATELTREKDELISQIHKTSLMDSLQRGNFEGYADRESLYRTLAEVCGECGISISPGYKLRSHFIKSPANKPLAYRLYGEVVAIYKDQIALLDKWSAPQVIEVPPLLSILLTQAKCREEIPETLVSLRERFGELREAMRSSTEALSPDMPLRERLDAVRQLESVREVILKKAVLRPTTTIVRRTWNIVKKGSLLSAFTNLTDILMEWDEERQLLGGLHHFVDLERLTLEAEDNAKNLFRLFGDVSR